MANTTKIADKDAGTALVNFGSLQIITIVSNTKPNIVYSEGPVNHCPPSSLNCSNWDIKMMMARPLTKPRMTGVGTNRMNFPIRAIPVVTCIRPANTTVANTYSTPWEATSDTNTTATAPVAPEIIPGRPPRIEVTNPIINAAYNPVRGDNPAISAKATASGTSAIATVRPDNTSVL